MLTQAYEPDLQAKMDATPPGMAYWAGTGPEGVVCHQCIFWGATKAKSGPTYKRNEADVLKPKRCSLYAGNNNSQRCPTGVPAITPSCRYFVEAIRFPPLHREPKL